MKIILWETEWKFNKQLLSKSRWNEYMNDYLGSSDDIPEHENSW